MSTTETTTDWSTNNLTTGEIILCTAAAAASTATAGIYTDMAQAAPYAPFSVTAAAAAGHAIYSARAEATTGTITIRAASWLFAGGWTSWHLESVAPPTVSGWVTAACGGILAFALNYAASKTEPERSNKAAILAFKKQASKSCDEWVQRIESKANIENAVCNGFDAWEHGAGYTVSGHFTDGSTWEDLSQHERGFASELALPDGCGVEVGKGEGRNGFTIRVSTRNMIAETVYMEEDFSELTINEPFSLGSHRDGTDPLVSLLNDCGIIVGDTDSGKTNLLNAIISKLARMPDVLIWAVDITGAGVALPWIIPWAVKEEGRDVQASAPIIDWIAHTPAEARVMLRMALQIIAARKAGYQGRMRKANTDKLPVDHDVPSIIIVADETAELGAEIQALIDSGLNTGRAVRVRYLNSALRATMDTITSAMKKRCKLRIGMHTEDPEELAYLFAGYKQLDMADAPVSGSGFFTFKTPVRTFKSRRVVPGFLTDASIACAGRRPVLDKVSCGVPLYEQYQDRWARAIPDLFLNNQDAAEPVTLSDEVEAYLASLGAGAGKALTGQEGIADPTVNESLSATMQDGMSMGGAGMPDAEQVQATLAALHAGNDTEGTLASMSEIVNAANEQNSQGVLPGARPVTTLEDRANLMGVAVQEAPTLTMVKQAPAPAQFEQREESDRERAYSLLWRSGAQGLGATELTKRLEAEGKNVARTTVQGWMKKWAETGKAVTRGSGSHTRYFHIDHKELAPSEEECP